MTPSPAEPTDSPPDGAAKGLNDDAPKPPPGWRRILRWGENLLWLAVLGFALVRLGPQIGAWIGVGPSMGAAPEFSVRTLEGTTVDRDRVRGKVTIVNFWATWCPPCRVEIPALEALHEEFQGEGLVVLGLSTDLGGTAKVEAFLEEKGVTYPVAMADGATRNAFGGVSALPTTFILDRDGVIRHRVFGFFAPPAMRAAVRRLLQESPASSPSARQEARSLLTAASRQ